jgi:homoserine dehydrogenase
MRGSEVRERETIDPVRCTVAAPLRVGLLGLGTVGFGVYRKLVEQPAAFEVCGIAIRDLQKHAAHAPGSLLTLDCERAVSEADVVVELIGGLEPARQIASATLAAGKPFITANKRLVASGALDRWYGSGLLHFSAAVGGEVPMLETVRLCAKRGAVAKITGVLNGTTNFILDRMAEGESFAAALAAAQANGFAEADPSCDLNGSDAACKLALLIREAFGVAQPVKTIACQGIEEIDAGWVRQISARGERVRLVAEAEWRDGELHAQVAPQVVSGKDVFGLIRNEENCLRIEGAFPPVILTGRGAGRWPTTASVMADVMDVARVFGARPDVNLALAGGAA